MKMFQYYSPTRTLMPVYQGAILDEIEKDNEHYVILKDLTAYRAIPGYDILLGEPFRLLMSREQYQDALRLHKLPQKADLHPKLWDISKCGMSSTKLEGWITESHTLSVCMDKEGNLWHGQPNYEFPVFYWDDRQFSCIAPGLTYLGHVSDTKLRHRVWESDPHEVHIATEKILDFIKEEGMLGYYSPAGKARTSFASAKRECLARKSKMVRTMEAEMADLRKETQQQKYQADQLRLELEAQRSETSKLNEMIDQLQQELQKERGKQVDGLEAAIQRAEAAEAALDIARKNNTGWDWSNL